MLVITRLVDKVLMVEDVSSIVYKRSGIWGDR